MVEGIGQLEIVKDQA